MGRDSTKNASSSAGRGILHPNGAYGADVTRYFAERRLGIRRLHVVGEAQKIPGVELANGFEIL